MSATRIRAVLVDDEVLARLALRQALASHPEIEVVGECGHVAEAERAIEALEPDLLFLDIQMPGADGFELLRRLDPESLPLVVFATAFDAHALQAFEAGALDDVLKPIRPGALRLHPRAGPASVAAARPRGACRAALLHRETLRALEAALDPARFLRIHRGILVRI